MKELFESHLWPVAGLEFDDRKIAVAWKPSLDIALRPTIQFRRAMHHWHENSPQVLSGPW